MKKIIYNKDFLPNLVKRIIEKDHATKSMIVEALNEKDDKKKTSLSQLNLWIKDEAVLPTKKIINLVNNMENVSLFDFFIYEDGTKIEEMAASVSALQTLYDIGMYNEFRAFSFRKESDYLKVVDDFLQRLRKREDEIRQECEKKITKRESELREIIISKENEIMLYKKLLKDKEMEIMKNQVEQLEKLLLKMDSIKVLPESSEESKLWRAEVDDLFRTMYGQYSPQYDEIHQLLFLTPLATPSGNMSSLITYEERLCKIESIIKETIS